MEQLHKTLKHCLDNIEIKVEDDEMNEIFDYSDLELIDKFIASKEIEGCSERTIKYYKSTLLMLNDRMNLHVTHMTTDNLRGYLTNYQKNNDCSKLSIDNIRNLSSFFSWLEEENYII
jgi:site-specific recombinase XerD